MHAKILAFSGSSRLGSVNQRVLDIAAKGAMAAGASITALRLSDLDLPIYDGDMETGGLPPGACRLKEMIAAHDALLIASPDYNGGYTPLLKNALDWASRPGTTLGPNVFSGKLAAVVSASPGLLGGIRSQVSLLPVLHKLGMHVVPASFALGLAFQMFDQDGAITDSTAHDALGSVGAALVKAIARFTKRVEDK